MKPGERLDLTGPYGEFCYRQHENCRHVFLATGIGISPFRSILRSHTIEAYILIHGIRDAADLKLSEGLDSSRLVTCISRENGGSIRGRITDYLQSMNLEPHDLFYISGNPAAVKDISDVLRQKGVHTDRIIKEFYYTY